MPPTDASHQVRAALEDFLKSRVEPGDVVLLGVSGGADSMALAAAAAALSSKLSITFVPVIVDHQLQTGSADVANQAATECQRLGLTQSLVVPVQVHESGEGLEAAARNARYEAFHHAIAQTGAIAIMLAHSLEDQAETVLMRLSRGSGTRSLAAMSADQGIVWRPLLNVSRKILRSAVEEQQLNIFEDPHNSDSRFLRVRIRSEVMPLLRDVLGDSVDEALARTAFLARDDADALDALAELEVQRRLIDGDLDIQDFSSLPRAISSRCIRMWLSVHGVTQVNFEHIDSVLRLATDPRVAGPVKVAGGVDISKASGRLRA